MIKLNGIFSYSIQLIVSVLVILNYFTTSVHASPLEHDGILNSLKNLTEWAIKEETIYKLAKTRQLKLTKELQILEEFIDDYKSTTGQAVTYAVPPLKNPKERAKLVASSGIASYRMIYRYATYLTTLRQVLTEYDHHLEDLLLQSVGPEINEVGGSTEHPEEIRLLWPSVVDVNDAMQAIIHLQEVYDFPLAELPYILSPDTHRPAELNAFHCAQIGLHAEFKEYYAIAVDWLDFAETQISKEGDMSIPSVLVNNYKAMVIKSHNDAFTRLPDYDGSVFVKNVTFHEKIPKRRTLQYEHFAGEKASNFATINFWGLCSGDYLQSRQEVSRLHCYYEHDTHPAWQIMPMKVEVLSEDPPVVQIYDVLGNKTIEQILNRSQAELSRSGVVGEENFLVLTKTRTSVNSWVRDDEMPELTKKMEMITGLKVHGENASEMLQVVEYVFGRYYAVHTDPLYSKMEALPPSDMSKGDRLATLLFYLNDVEAGGYTPFANAGTFAPPIKGSAIFWMNLYKNGTMREDTWHGACPVIYGHKIVANKWIRYNAQFQTLQCSLDPNE